MRRFQPVESVATLLDRDNIDTDQVLPAAFMRGIDPDYGAGLFALWRRDPAFVLNRPGWEKTAILVSGANFGCGSTREHACWALDEFGIRVLIAASFGEVFRDNCIRNGILPIAAGAEGLARLRSMLRDTQDPVHLLVDLATQRVTSPGFEMAFDLPAADKTALLEGLDEIGMTLLEATAIDRWESAEKAGQPWLQTLRTPL
ncbi:3-isopropylmalate dehydratase small subunit [Acidisphaera sp. L21]|uniref:3-isopropylmalate dehydratase small subunit n=1 Tax=Acidisphaera sp. L21 TaxID=1641851 RepID=UPI00131D7724|nr:3-isopropylmalate dehydratase small subunit [Acidisphaera sp. L21]